MTDHRAGLEQHADSTLQLWGQSPGSPGCGVRGMELLEAFSPVPALRGATPCGSWPFPRITPTSASIAASPLALTLRPPSSWDAGDQWATQTTRLIFHLTVHTPLPGKVTYSQIRGLGRGCCWGQEAPSLHWSPCCPSSLFVPAPRSFQALSLAVLLTLGSRLVSLLPGWGWPPRVTLLVPGPCGFSAVGAVLAGDASATMPPCSSLRTPITSSHGC